MERSVVIKVEGLSKKFSTNLKRSLFYGTIDLFRNMIGRPTNFSEIRTSEFWALDDINFELRKGEILGIIGMNGSGKSTLLRILTGIYPPDTGRIEIHGQIGGLIAVGAGFHPHMTGRENIFLNGTILGMTREELTSNFDDIVEFAEVGEFLDAPVSTYSSGMKVRLGFAIAIHVKPDILLIDEVLSVGDINFRNKCARKIKELREKAKGIIFISHNLEQVLNISDRVIVLDKGKILFDGDPNEAVVEYHELNTDNQVLKHLQSKGHVRGEHITTGDVELISIDLLNESNKIVSSVESGQNINIVYDFKIHSTITRPRIASAIRDENNNNVIWQLNVEEGLEIPRLEEGHYKLKVSYETHNLAPGFYNFVFNVQSLDTLEYYEKFALKNVYGFKVPNTTTKQSRGIISLSSEWSIDKID